MSILPLWGGMLMFFVLVSLLFIHLECPFCRDAGDGIEAVVASVSGPYEVVAEFELCTNAELAIVVNSLECSKVYPKLGLGAEDEGAINAIVV